MFEIGVLFDVDELGSNYGSEAYKIFFRNLDPNMMKASIIRVGDVDIPSYSDYSFCIGIMSFDPSVTDYVKNKFINCNDKGIRPLGNRFIENVSSQPLVIAARVNHNGNLEDMKYIQEHSLQGTNWRVV